jgi:hypothetical protein
LVLSSSFVLGEAEIICPLSLVICHLTPSIFAT